jgi:ribosomal protein S7
MPFYKIKKYYLHLKENKLEIMQLIIGKLMKRGFKMRAFKVWVNVLVLIKLQFIRPQLLLLTPKTPQEFFKVDPKLNFSKISIQKNSFIISEQQQAFLEFNNLKPLFLSYSITTVEQFLYTAIDNMCPIILFTKKQKERHLILIPIYSKHYRDIKLGLTWLVFTSQDASYHSTLNFAERLYLHLSKAAVYANDSEIINLKMQYYSIAHRNKKYIEARQYFF